jgi:imidazolonepropionase-like amidohydrolase
LNYWYTIGLIEYPKVLKTLVESTPRAIFPNRKIGRIEEGYEASFLAISDNPIGNILKLRMASIKMKNGVLFAKP